MKTFLLTLLLAQAAAPFRPADDQIARIEARAAELEAKLAATPAGLLKDDVAIHAKAARMMLRHREEFYRPDYVKHTLDTLDRGMAKLAGTAPKGPRVCHAYRSRVDESLQPYCLAIPAGYDAAKPVRLDVILHGRNATLTEASFLATHETAKPLPEAQTWIELEVFGRTNNAYRWAGETDVFEALAATKARYAIDPARVTLRGFSMGGAGAWHIGLHHPSEWAAIEAGAGFVDTKKYQKITSLPAWQEKTLHVYDAVDYAENALNVPTVGYGGEIDPQLAASRTIQAALAGMKPNALFLVGPKTEHKWHPDSKKTSDAFIDQAAARGRPDPERIHFVTYTTRYHRAFWLSVEGLEKHYEKTVVTVEGRNITTVNVSRLRIDREGDFTLDGQKVRGSGEFEKTQMRWRKAGHGRELRKRPGLQGPIDDAFRDAFVTVNAPPRIAAEWNKWMRGELPARDRLTDADLRDKHAVLFGDPSTNPLIAKINSKLPVRWKDGQIVAGDRHWDAATHTLALIYPNPQNPARYVVLNSGHTFGEKEFKASNAQLYPRLPDWAVIEKATQQVAAAGFFDEHWRLQ